MKHEAPGPKKPTDKRTPEEVPEGKRHRTPEASPADSAKPSAEEVINRWRDPITNQDEQEKITNTGGDGIPMPDK